MRRQVLSATSTMWLSSPEQRLLRRSLCSSKTLLEARQWAETYAAVFAWNKFQPIYLAKAYKSIDAGKTLATP